MINAIYHLTSNHCWNQIKNDGCLKPLSDPGLHIKDLSDKTKEIIEPRNYLVGMPIESFESWENYGLLENVERYAVHKNPYYGLRPGRNNFVVLRVPILRKEGAFVREHKYPTSKWGDQFMPGAISEVGDGELSEASDEEIEFVDGLWFEYHNSTIRLEDYHGQFEVPEIWLPQKTPVDLIKIVCPKLYQLKSSFKFGELNNYYGCPESEKLKSNLS